MFITNPNEVSNLFKCNELVGEYLIKHGFSLIGREDGKMLFSNTEKLKTALENSPVHIKLLARW